jgi:hypothetical protein
MGKTKIPKNFFDDIPKDFFIEEVSPGLFKIGKGCFTGIGGMKTIKSLMDEKRKQIIEEEVKRISELIIKGTQRIGIYYDPKTCAAIKPPKEK